MSLKHFRAPRTATCIDLYLAKDNEKGNSSYKHLEITSVVCHTESTVLCTLQWQRQHHKTCYIKAFFHPLKITHSHQKQINTHLIELSVNTQYKGQDIQNFNTNSTTTFVPKIERANSR